MRFSTIQMHQTSQKRLSKTQTVHETYSYTGKRGGLLAAEEAAEALSMTSLDSRASSTDTRKMAGMASVQVHLDLP